MKFKNDRQRKAVMSNYNKPRVYTSSNSSSYDSYTNEMNASNKRREKERDEKETISRTPSQQKRIDNLNKNAKKGNDINVRELQLFGESDSQLYNSNEVPIQKNLSKRYKNGTYDKESAKLAWYNWSTNAEKKYTKEFGSSGMTVGDRSKLAIIKEKEWRYEMELGNFNE